VTTKAVPATCARRSCGMDRPYAALASNVRHGAPDLLVSSRRQLTSPATLRPETNNSEIIPAGPPRRPEIPPARQPPTPPVAIRTTTVAFRHNTPRCACALTHTDVAPTHTPRGNTLCYVWRACSQGLHSYWLSSALTSMKRSDVAACGKPAQQSVMGAGAIQQANVRLQARRLRPGGLKAVGVRFVNGHGSA